MSRADEAQALPSVWLEERKDRARIATGVYLDNQFQIPKHHGNIYIPESVHHQLQAQTARKLREVQEASKKMDKLPTGCGHFSVYSRPMLEELIKQLDELLSSSEDLSGKGGV